MDYIVCIGNGLHADGSTSWMNQAIIKKAIELWEKDTQRRIIFSGGYKNKMNVTEVDSMERYFLAFFSSLDISYMVEDKSYRTHNNAVETLKIVSRISYKGAIIVVDHPEHIKRTVLSFKSANRLYFNDRFEISGHAAEEVYDANIPGQSYWATQGLFKEYERKRMLLYKVLLFRPWARLGMSILCRVWPSYKQ